MDRNGYLWFGTEAGLVRFDGTQFRVFNQLNTPLLTSDRIGRLALMKDGTLLVEGEGARYFTIDTNSRWQIFLPDAKNLEELNSVSGSNGYNLFDSCKQRISENIDLDWIMPDRSPTSYAIANRLKYIHGRCFYFNRFRELISTDTGFRSFSRWKIEGQLSELFRAAKADSLIPSILSDNEQLYVRFGNWIFKLDIDEQRSVAMGSRLLEVDEIANISYFQKWSNLNMMVVGTMADGLYLFRKKLFSNLQFKNLELNVFHAQAPFGNDGVLTNWGLLYPNRTVPAQMGELTSESVLKSRDGHFYLNKWMSEKDAGIVELDEHLKRIQSISADSLHVSCFRQFRNGTIWFSDYVHFLEKLDSGKISFIPRPEGIPENFQVQDFIQNKDNDDIWVAGTLGLIKLDSSGIHGKIVSELANVNIRCVFQDKKGVLWLGSYGKGFYAIANNEVIPFPMDKDKCLSATHSFLEDRNGYLWITTNTGMFQASLEDLYRYIRDRSYSPYYYHYEKSDGFLTNEFNGGCSPSGIILGNGKFSFPSMRALVQFDPDSVKPIFPNSPIRIDAVMMDTFPTDPTMETIRIPSNINRILFVISSPYFGRPYNQYIEYRITGLDSNWYPVNEEGIIELNRLDKGDYQLVLRKKSGFGMNNYVTTVRNFNVAPTFYQTWIFRCILLTLTLLFAYLFYRFRMEYLISQKKVLENEVQLRTGEQQKLIDDLEMMITELEDSKEQLHQNTLFKEKLAMVIMHDLQSPLRFLFDATRRIHEKSVRQQYEKLNESSIELYRATGKIYGFVEDFAFWLSTMGKNFSIRNESIDLPALLNDLNQFFIEQLNANGNSIKISNHGVERIYADRQLLKIIFRNIIDNANKHTRRGIVHVQTSVYNGLAMIRIEDNGFGMDTVALEELNRRLKSSSAYYSEKETGFGYRFIVDLSRLMNMNVEVKSDKGFGTLVILSNIIIDNS